MASGNTPQPWEQARKDGRSSGTTRQVIRGAAHPLSGWMHPEPAKGASRAQVSDSTAGSLQQQMTPKAEVPIVKEIPDGKNTSDGDSAKEPNPGVSGTQTDRPESKAAAVSAWGEVRAAIAAMDPAWGRPIPPPPQTVVGKIVHGYIFRGEQKGASGAQVPIARREVCSSR
jgi:hypothetical protein